MFDTIVAPATPLASSALAVVRVDGPQAGIIAEALSGPGLRPRVATHRRLRTASGDLDDAVVTLYHGPESYSGNDAVEFSIHGSPYLITRLVEEVIQLGARLAEPGEFTERAVLNSKLDLLQAEGVLQLIESRTELQAKLSLAQLDGSLSRLAGEVRGTLLSVISRLEAALDFAEEGYEFILRDEVRSRLAAMESALQEMLASYRRGRAIVEGLTAVILGQPNAGKSTLMNFLCGSERAIVTEIPGTTRDLLRESIELGGLPVTLIDTAGLRSDSDPIEAIGIARAREVALRADLVLYLVDSARGLDEIDRQELSALPGALVVFSKADAALPPVGELAVSVQTGMGMEFLLRRLDQEVRARYGEATALLTNERQRRCVSDALEALKAANESMGNLMTEEIVLVDLYRAATAVGTLSGEITHREIMGEIFSKFCIGK